MKVGKYKKISGDKYIVEIDNEKIKMHEDVIIKNNLLYKKDISEKELDSIMDQNDYYKLYNKCIKLISNRIRSEKEIEEFLKDTPNDIKERIIKKLKENNLINDEIFVKCYINDKLLMSIYGPNKIKSELLKHNIDSDLIDKYIYDIDKNIFDEKINKIINKYVKNNTKYSRGTLKTKIYTYLINNGYGAEMFIHEINNISFDNKNLIEKDYSKILNKYSKKYSGKELNQKLKSALYAKGYSSEEINNIICE